MSGDDAPGLVVEARVRNFAADAGFADFIFHAPAVSKGSGRREVAGDGLLISGQRAAILQVKSRDPSKRVIDGPDRARSWVFKNAQVARRQGLGTRREITRRAASGTPVAVAPVRVDSLQTEVAGRYFKSLAAGAATWPIVVVIDHPDADGIDLGFDPDVIWITLDDWRELVRRFRSAFGLAFYVERVLEGRLHVALGDEQRRYEEVAEADAARPQAETRSVPLVPRAFEVDHIGVELLHDVGERVWPGDGFMPWEHPDEYRAIVEFIDRIPVQMQARAGRWIARKRSELHDTGGCSGGVLQIDRRDQLVYACAPWDDGAEDLSWLAEVAALTEVRRAAAIEAGLSERTETLGVGALVRGSGGVQYAFVLRSGPCHIDDETRRGIEWVYGVHDYRRGRAHALVIGANEACPCGSGKKFKRCHGKRALGLRSAQGPF